MVNTRLMLRDAFFGFTYRPEIAHEVTIFINSYSRMCNTTVSVYAKATRAMVETHVREEASTEPFEAR